jgi:hypothetical protein
MSQTVLCPSPASLAPREQSPTTGFALLTILLTAVYALPIVVALRLVADPLVDPDIWWHLRVGQWVTEHGTVPVNDPFSRSGMDKPWVAYSWLYEVLVYRLYQMFGLAGIVIYRVALSLAIVAALHRLIRRREPHLLVATGLTVIASFALAALFSERPWLFTILFAILTLDAILALREGHSSRWIWLLPVVYVLWANVHIQFVYGLLLLGLACLAPKLEELISNPRVENSGLSTRRMLILAGLCLAATLLNPYHVRLYGVVVEYATQSGPFRYVNELRAMEFREAPDWVVLLLGAAAVFALGWQRQLKIFEVLLIVCAAAFAFRSRRDLWILALAAVAILTSRTRRRDDTLPIPFPLRSWAAAVGLLMALGVLLAWQRDLSPENLERKVASVFPVEAAAVVAERGYPGPLFNDFNWGGFLIWRLPQLPVVVDGRTNLHGDERILRLGNTWAVGPGWHDDPDLVGAGIVVAEAHSPLAGVLAFDERFQQVYEDCVARVFVRRQPASTGLPRDRAGTP